MTPLPSLSSSKCFKMLELNNQQQAGNLENCNKPRSGDGLPMPQNKSKDTLINVSRVATSWSRAFLKEICWDLRQKTAQYNHTTTWVWTKCRIISDIGSNAQNQWTKGLSKNALLRYWRGCLITFKILSYSPFLNGLTQLNKAKR